jgi:hypothetical protein
MARTSCRPQATMERDLEPVLRACPGCCELLYAAYRSARTVTHWKVSVKGAYRAS